MGFAAAVSVPDGVAVAADSRVEGTILGRGPVVVSDTQQKIVPLSHNAVAVLPDPYFDREGGSSILNLRHLLEQIRPDLGPEPTLEELLSELPGRMTSRAKLSDDERERLDLRLVGYSELDRTVKVMLLEGLDSEASERHSSARPGLDWFGFIDVASRIVNGRSEREQREEPGWAYDIPTIMMSLDDAVDLAETLVRTTATFGKFVRVIVSPSGEPEALSIPAGGPVQSVAVTRSGIEWMSGPRRAAAMPPRADEPSKWR